jgi:hypothetical protein
MLVFKQLFTFLKRAVPLKHKIGDILAQELANLNGAFEGKKVMTYQA